MLTRSIDLLAVRKIHLREHPYISEDAESGSKRAAGPSTQRQKPDPAARILTREMQKIVATDRDIHEKVCSAR